MADEEEELPKIISDEDFEKLQKERREHDGTDQDAWVRAELGPRRPPTDGKPETTLEQLFPHVVKKIVQTWPSEICGKYLNELVMPNRSEVRQGFPMDVIEDLMLLAAINVRLLRSGAPSAAPPKEEPKDRWN